MKGFSLIEVLVAMGLSVLVLIMVVTHVNHSLRVSRKVIDNQRKMEMIFHTMEMIRSDLTKCGMRLREPARIFGLSFFGSSSSSFSVTYGISSETLLENSSCGDQNIAINRSDFFQKGKAIVIYNPEGQAYEFNEIISRSGNQVKLKNLLMHDYPQYSPVVALKEVEYKLYPKECVLKRKVNQGYFQPLIEDVTDFYVQFYPEANSVFYRIEVSEKEQLRGYIFLAEMVNN